VEGSHATIEAEFYDMESFARPARFMVAAGVAWCADARVVFRGIWFPGDGRACRFAGKGFFWLFSS
jgi:hypothetical protein